MNLLPRLTNKNLVDRAIREIEDMVVVLRFGQDQHPDCMKLDETLYKAQPELENMAAIFAVDIHEVPTYTAYFEIIHIPALVFFFNTHHMKVDFQVTPDHTKFVGCFRNKQDFIDLIEVIFRTAMKGKYIARSPIDPRHLTKYDLLYKGI
jgi:thiol-disulfide isomerase/thioredoxin